MTPRLRVVDGGSVSAVRSQALWHGIAEAMEPGDDPVLSFCAPAEPYVCVGYHRRLEELDIDVCRELGLPVLRRQIGGGPVYLDADQLFFQLSLPADRAPARVTQLYQQLLEPAAVALRSLGVPAEVSGTNDLVARGRKISGTGAGQIGGGVVVVGNVMFAFPHERMAAVLRLPDEQMRAECLALMRRHVGTLPMLSEADLKAALSRAYASSLGRAAAESAVHEREQAAIAAWEQRLSDREWVAGPALPPLRGRQVKVRAGVWVYDGSDADVRVRVTVEDGLIRAAQLDAPALNGSANAIASALLGAPAQASALASQLRQFEDDGQRVLRALGPGLVVR